MNTFQKNLMVGMLANRIMIMRLAGAMGLKQGTVNQFQDEAIELAEKEYEKQLKEVKKLVKEEGKKDDKNNK